MTAAVREASDGPIRGISREYCLQSVKENDAAPDRTDWPRELCFFRIGARTVANGEDS
jgi:hypothetical protein